MRMTETAAKQICKIAEKEQRSAILRLSVQGGGCSGFSYNFQMADAPAEDDDVFELDGAMLLVDRVSQPYLDAAELDWDVKILGSHFAIRNPQAKSGCGCGTSFAV